MDKSLKNAFNMLVKGKKSSEKTAIVLTTTTHRFKEKYKIFPYRYVENYVCLPIGIKNKKSAKKIIQDFDGKVDIFFVDIENKLRTCYNLFEILKNDIIKSKIYAIKGNDFTADATFAIVMYFLSSIARKEICVIGAGNIGSKVALKLLESGGKIYVFNSTKKSSQKVASAINIMKPKECPDNVKAVTKNSLPKNLDCIIGFTRGNSVITKSIVANVNEGGFILDGGQGTISTSGINEARKKKITLYKVDIRMGFLSNAYLMKNTEKLMSKIYGHKRIKNFNIIAGGYIGNKGDVIVNSISNPTNIIGISDGNGGLLKSKLYKKNVRQVRKILTK